MADTQPTQPNQPDKKHPRLLKWLGVAALVLLTLALLVVLAVGLLLGTERGRLWLLDTGLEFGLGEGALQVQIENPRSPALGEWSFARVHVTREQQTWIDIRDLHLQWQPRELIERRVLVEALEIGQLDFHTDVEAPPQAEPESEEESEFSPPAVAIKYFQLDELNIIGAERDLPAYAIGGDLHLFWQQVPVEVNLQARSLADADGQPAMALDLSTTAETRERLRLQGQLQEQAGGLIGELLKLPEGTPIDARFQTTLDMSEGGYQLDIAELRFPFGEHDLSAKGELAVDQQLEQVRIGELLIGTDDRQHRVAGTVSRQNMDLSINLDQFPLELLSPWVEQIDGGQVSAELAAAGPVENPEVTGQVSGNTQYTGQPVTLTLSGQFSRELLQFQQLELGFGQARLLADGQLDLQADNSDLGFTLHEFPTSYLTLFEVPLPKDLQGELVSANGRIRGDYMNPDAELQAHARGSYRDQAFTAQLQASGTRELIELTSANVQMDDATAQASGTVDLVGDRSNVRVELDQLPLALAELAGVELPADLSLRLDGDIRAQGALQSPQVEGELAADGRYRDQPFQMNIAGSGSRYRVELRQARATVGQASLAAEGSVDLQAETADMRINLDNAPVNLVELANIEPPEDLSGTLSGTASVVGPWRSPEVDSQLQAVGEFQELPFTLTADASYADQRAQFDQVALKLDGQTALEISGYWHPDNYDLRLSAQDLPTTTLSALGWDLVTGDFNGELHIEGTPDEPAIEGEFVYTGNLSGVDLASGDRTTFELGWRTQLETVEQTLNVRSIFTRDQQETGSLLISAPISRYLNHLRQDDAGPLPLDFNAEGAADLAVLSLVLDPDIHRISGRAAMRMEGSGNLEEPDLSGVFELLNTSYENTLSGTRLRDIQLLLRSRGTEITIEEGSARGSGSGRIELSGSVDWQEPEDDQAVDVQVVARNVNLINREDVEGEVSGDLALRGSFSELWLRGDVEVAPLSANVDAALQSQIPEIEVTEVYGDKDADLEAEEVAAAVGPTINLDLRISAEQQAYLRGRGLEAELAGDIHLRGTLAEPTYEGEFSIVRGVFEVFGRKFNLQEGEVLFANNALYMLIPGEYEHEDYTIRAELSGTVDDISLKLSSVPSLPEDEILSLLIFGKSAQNITPFQAIRLASAVQTLRGGGGGFDPIGSTRDVLGVDTLSVESATTESGSGVSVGVGKYVNERVYLEVRRSPSEIQPWQGSVEIELTPRLHLRSSAGGEGRTRAELLWRRDF